MEWGIINKENFVGKTTYDVPIKRWDPLSTVSITTEDFGLRKERQRYYGHFAYISPIRSARPKGFSSAEEKRQFYDCSKRIALKHKDVFTSITEGKTTYDDWGKQLGDGYTMIVTEDEKRKDNPFSKIPLTTIVNPRSARLSSLKKAVTASGLSNTAWPILAAWLITSSGLSIIPPINALPILTGLWRRAMRRNSCTFGIFPSSFIPIAFNIRMT